MAEFDEFPMWLHHPGEQPAVISDDYVLGPNRPVHHPPGQARQFPPVLVQNEDQMEYYKAKGYEPGNSNKEAATRAKLPPGYEFSEFPAMVDGKLVPDPAAPPPETNEFPQWVIGPDGNVIGDKPVNNAEEKAELLARGSSKNEPVRRVEEDASIAAFYGDPAPEGAEGAAGGDEPDLLADALALGIKADRRWGEARLRREIDAALAGEAA